MDEGNWEYRCTVDDVVKVTIDGGNAQMTVQHNGYTDVIFTDEIGNRIVYYVTVSGSSIYMHMGE